MRWTWFIEREDQCWPETFATPAQAIDAMGERQNWDSQEVDIPARMAVLGMFLASVRVTVEPVMVLRPHGVPVDCHHTFPPAPTDGAGGKTE